MKLERVGVNLLFLLPARGGMETVSRRLTEAVVKEASEVEFIVYADGGTIERLRATEAWADAVRFVGSPAGAAHKARRVAAELSWLPWRAGRDRVQVLFSQGNTAPIRCPVPSVPTIHDLLYRRYPGTHPRAVRLGLDLVVPRAARAATRVIVPSEATKVDVTQELGVAGDRVDVVRFGPGRPPGRARSSYALRRELSAGELPIVLSIAVGFEHKNLSRLLEAFAQVLERRDALLVQLGVVTSYQEPALRALADGLGISDHVRFIERFDDETLDAAYSEAALLVHPSLLEGFGLPPLEAMTRGCPVACSDISSLPEVVGDAAELFDPESVDEIRDAILRLLTDEGRRARLIERGRAQSARFSWDSAARGVLDSLAAAAGAR